MTQINMGVVPASILGTTSHIAAADTITFGGNITQSTADGTGPAGSNASPNNIQGGDLLEDAAVTDIQGNVTAYSYTPVPVPASGLLLAPALVALLLVRGRPGSEAI